MEFLRDIFLLYWKAQSEADNLRATLTEECKAREELQRKIIIAENYNNSKESRHNMNILIIGGSGREHAIAEDV